MTEHPPVEIDGPTALRLLQQATELAGPNYVASRCTYAQGGAPHCIVGTALSLAGVPVEVLQEMDNADTVDTTDIDELEATGHLANWGIALTPAALVMFRVAQAVQDAKRPWGEAVMRAARHD